MTDLEQTLATLLAAIDAAKAAGPSPLLAALLRRKNAICAALAAPEHGWHAGHAGQTHALNNLQRPCEDAAAAPLPALADTGV
jgi:hypothetical protein